MPNSQKVYPIGWEIFDEKKRISAFRRKKERKRKVSEIVAEKKGIRQNIFHWARDYACWDCLTFDCSDHSIFISITETETEYT